MFEVFYYSLHGEFGNSKQQAIIFLNNLNVVIMKFAISFCYYSNEPILFLMLCELTARRLIYNDAVLPPEIRSKNEFLNAKQNFKIFIKHKLF